MIRRHKFILHAVSTIVLTSGLVIDKSLAQQAGQTSGVSLETPSFNPIDANGVDLLSGKLNVRSPSLSMGDERSPNLFYFTWSGQSWLPNTPRLWLNKDWHVIIEYDGISEEFADAVKNDSGIIPGLGSRFIYTQKRPNIGSKLECYFTGGLTGNGWISACFYTSRQGVLIRFWGNLPYNAGYPPNATYDNEAFGNTRAWPSIIIDPATGSRSYLYDGSVQQNVGSNGAKSQ